MSERMTATVMMADMFTTITVLALFAAWVVSDAAKKSVFIHALIAWLSLTQAGIALALGKSMIWVALYGVVSLLWFRQTHWLKQQLRTVPPPADNNKNSG